MYITRSFGRGDIVFMCDTYYMVKKLDEESRTITIIQLNGDSAGVLFIKDFDEFCIRIEKHYSCLGDFITSLGKNQKEKISKLREMVLSQGVELISLNDEIGALKDELQECYEISDFKNKEIERLHKENLKSVKKDTFDKAVNDMLNNKDISTVEEVSAIMKLRSAIYY